MRTENAHSKTGKIIEVVGRFITLAYSRAALPYLVFGGVLIIAVVAGGREIEHHLNAIEIWLTKLGPWGVLVFVGLFVLATSFLLPDTVLCIIAGALFGMYWGVAAVLAGSLLAGAVQFALAKKLLRTQVQQAIAAKPSPAAIQRAVRHSQFRLQLLLRLTPLNPAMINYILGATGVRFSGFLFACLALTPNLAIEVYFGYAGMHAARLAGRGVQNANVQELLVIGGFLVCVVVMVLVSKKAHKEVMQAVGKAEMTDRKEGKNKMAAT
ncbi:MAG: VTT domain-containing protein [Desulforhopalus sp.]